MNRGEMNSVVGESYGRWRANDDTSNWNEREQLCDVISPSARKHKEMLRIDAIVSALSSELETWERGSTTSTKLAILSTKLRNCHSSADDAQLRGRLLVLARLAIDWIGELSP